MKQRLGVQRVLALILLLIAVIALTLSIVGMVQNAGGKAIDARKGIVLVACYDAQGAFSWGTGWAIGKPGQPVEYIVTNGHVVEDAAEYGGAVQIYFSAAENDFVIPNIIYYSQAADKDLSILKLPSPTAKREALILRDSDTVELNETAVALGYPGLSAESQSYTTFDQNDITVTSGVIGKRTYPSGTNYEAFQMDTYINHGNSGGPLVDTAGFVIGINTLGWENENMNFAILTNELTRILDSERIPYTMKGYSNWMVFAFLPLTVLAGAGAAVLWVLTNKQPAVSGAGGQAAPGAGGRAVPSPMLRGVSGLYAGQTFALTRTPQSPGGVSLTIGRDPKSCNIVFPPDTPGVSSSHCSVRFDPQTDGFLLTDLGSSYGTFLGGGKKLAAQVPERLTAGDSFYLADGGNRFVVCKE